MGKTKYSYNLETLTAEDDISCYLLGAFITDGCIHTSKKCWYKRAISIASCDYNWLEIIRAQLCPDKPITKGRTCFRIVFTYDKMTDWFIEHGILPNKSLTAVVPNIPEQFVPDFLRGCMDGDGCIGMYDKKYKTKQGIKTCKCPECYICSASPVFINNISKLLNDFNIKHYIDKVQQKDGVIDGNRIIKGGGYLYKVRFTSLLANDFLEWIYYPDHRIAMPRKAKLAQNIIDYYETKYPEAPFSITV
jgi:intein/homing endonuclease